MKQTGERLRKAREEKGLSLNEISLSLKISTKVLTAMEEGDLSRLPAKTFLRGFVQSYANFLRLNADEILALFSEEMNPGRPSSPEATSPEVGAESTGPVAQPSAPAPTPASTPLGGTQTEPLLAEIEGKSKARVFIISGVCLLLLFLIFATARVVDRYQRETIPAEIAIGQPLSQDEEDGVPELGEASDEDNEADATAAAAEVQTPASPEVPATTTSSPPPSEPPAAPATAPAPTTPVATPTTPPTPPAPAPAPPPAAATAAAPTPSAPAPSGKSIELIIEALDTVEVEYGSAGGGLRKIQLGPDRVHTIRSRDGLRLNISNGGAVNLNLNGRDLGVPGDIGKPIKLSY